MNLDILTCGGSMTQEQLYGQIQQVLQAYERNPDAFTEEDIAKIKQLTNSVGMDWNPKFSGSRFFRGMAFEAADTALLGALPNEWGPQTYGDESIGATLGGMLGLAVPGALALKAGKMAYGGVSAVAQGLGRGGLRAGSALHKGMATTSIGAKIQNRISRLRTLARTVENPRLKEFYRGALRRAYGAVAVAEPGVINAARYAATPVAAMSRFPRAVKYGTAAPVFMGITDALEEQPYDPYAEYPEEEGY
jgi:hypothetical protein